MNQEKEGKTSMAATVPKHVRLGQDAAAQEDLRALRASGTAFSPSGRPSAESLPIRSFTTEDLPSTTRPLSLEKTASEMLQTSKLALMQGINNINKENVSKLGSAIVDTVKNTFTQDESERILREDWMLVECEDEQLVELEAVVKGLEKAFQFSKGGSTLVDLATSTLKRCQNLVERSETHGDQCQMMFSQCSNEITTVQDYLGKLRDAVNPVVPPKDKNEEKRNARRAEWALGRMQQSVDSMVTSMRELVEELDDLISECTKLMVQAITLVHMRARSADFSGTGVAAGAAGIVAGAVVGVAGIIAAPATGGLSIPISVAGKGLFFGGVATLAPSGIMLNRHSQQLTGLTKLVEHLKTRLEIMSQKRVELSTAFAASEDVELNVKQATNFCQDAIELEVSIYESAWSFIEGIAVKLALLDKPVTMFLESPSLWHYCKTEDELHQYLLPDEEEEDR